jgi:LmbE family N-acetylglucosaminyl deacetylase
MKFLNFDRVLCLSPHPDDVEYSMSGTILKHGDTHFDILCLTQGGDCDETTSQDRIIEMHNAWNVSQANNYTVYSSDSKLLKDKDVDQWINYIETTYMNKFKYDCIMTTSEHDSHFEHGIVSSLSAPLSRVKAYSIIQYRSPSTLETWIPNLFVSLDGFLDIKKKMLQQFKSQIDRPYFSDIVLNGFHTNFQCMKKGKGFVESFKVITFYE